MCDPCVLSSYWWHTIHRHIYIHTRGQQYQFVEGQYQYQYLQRAKVNTQYQYQYSRVLEVNTQYQYQYLFCQKVNTNINTNTGTKSYTSTLLPTLCY